MNDATAASIRVELDTPYPLFRHLVQVQNDDHWFQASVDAHTGEGMISKDSLYLYNLILASNLDGSHQRG